jgi:beta propeller repeat protein
VAALGLLAVVPVSRSESPVPGPIRPDLVTVRISPRILTHDLAAQIEPAISGNLIVFTDFRNAQADIYLWDLGVDPNRETRLTDGPQEEHSPDISGTTVVYVDAGPDTGGGDIMALEIGGAARPVAVESRSRQTHPAVKGTLVAWEDDRDGNPEIYARDLLTGEQKRITATADDAEMDPAVDGGRVVFARRTPDGRCGIHLVDFATLATRVIAAGNACYRHPDIDGDFVVYDGTPDGTQDIFVHDLRDSSTTRVVLAGIQREAHISGPWLSAEKVAMVPFQNSNVKIYHIPQQTPLEPLTAETNEFDSDISGRVVVYTTDALGNPDIAMYSFEPIGLNTPPVADAGPDFEVGCRAADATPVVLDGSRSTDPDGDAMTYRWTGPFADGAAEAEGQTPTVALPLGDSAVTLVVNDGEEDSAPDTVNVGVRLEARGLHPVLDGPRGAGGRTYKAGGSLPLRLSLLCNGVPMTGRDIAPPRLVSPGEGGEFRDTGGAWTFHLNTRGLAAGEQTLLIDLPDGRRLTFFVTLR